MLYGKRCVGCSAEDCVCCEVFLEHMADQRYQQIYGDDCGFDMPEYLDLGEEIDRIDDFVEGLSSDDFVEMVERNQ